MIGVDDIDMINIAPIIAVLFLNEYVLIFNHTVVSNSVILICISGFLTSCYDRFWSI